MSGAKAGLELELRLELCQGLRLGLELALGLDWDCELGLLPGLDQAPSMGKGRVKVRAEEDACSNKIQQSMEFLNDIIK